MPRLARNVLKPMSSRRKRGVSPVINRIPKGNHTPTCWLKQEPPTSIASPCRLTHAASRPQPTAGQA
jgi:hypothetical protein